jgi:hypothetical protein
MTWSQDGNCQRAPAGQGFIYVTKLIGQSMIFGSAASRTTNDHHNPFPESYFPELMNLGQIPHQKFVTDFRALFFIVMPRQNPTPMHAPPSPKRPRDRFAF